MAPARMSELRHKPSATRPINARSGAAYGANLGSRQNRRSREVKTMKTDRPEPNAELSQTFERTFEPLRFIFAIGALLLGFIASAHL